MEANTIREYVGYVANISKHDFTMYVQYLDVWQKDQNSSFPITLHFGIERCKNVKEKTFYRVRVNSTMTELTEWVF